MGFLVMSENPRSITEHIADAVGEWCRDNDDSLLTNFLFVGEFMEADGAEPTHMVCTPERSSQAAGLGLALYAQNLIPALQARDLRGLFAETEGDDD